MRCPNCQSQNIIKNGIKLLEKQIYRCKDCGRQFVLDPAKSVISDETKQLIDDMLLERIPLAGRAVGKETGQTSHIEHLNCTLRQRISRLVRKTLSFSKKFANHVGAIWYFIHHYQLIKTYIPLIIHPINFRTTKIYI